MFVVLYVGYEGYEEILWAGEDAKEAARTVLSLRREIEERKEHYYSDSDAWYSQGAPWNSMDNPDRVCVMKAVAPFKFECACKELGVQPSETIWH